MKISEYIKTINKRYKTGISREHSYRGDLQTLLEGMLRNVLVTNEPARIACGAPDFILTHEDIPVGYMEAKDIGETLTGTKHVHDFITTYPKAGSNYITNKLTKTDPGFIPYDKGHEHHTTPDDHRYPGEKLGKVQINNEQYFGNVPLKAWEFYIGGYQPAEKWLKDRRGRTLSMEEIQTTRRSSWP